MNSNYIRAFGPLHHLHLHLRPGDGFPLSALRLLVFNLPLFLSLRTCSSSQHWNRNGSPPSATQRDGFGGRITLDLSRTAIKPTGAIPAVPSSSAGHEPDHNQNTFHLQNGHPGGVSSESIGSVGRCSSPSETPGFQGTEIRALTGDQLLQGPLTGFTQMKGIAKGIKVASGFVKGLKAANGVMQKLETPAGDLLVGFGASSGVVVGLKAAKALTKGIKVSKGVASALQRYNLLPNGEADAAGKALQEKISTVAKGLKASHGAFKVVQLAKGVGEVSGVAELLHWSSILKGYKFSKSVLSVVEAVIGLRGGFITALGKGFVVVKGTVDGIGLMLKASFLSKELYIIVLKGLGIAKGTKAAFQAISEEFHEKHGHAPEDGLQSIKIYCTAIGGGNLDVSLACLNIHPSRSSYDVPRRSTSSILLLVNALTEQQSFESHPNMNINELLERGHFGILSLAIPAPTGGSWTF